MSWASHNPEKYQELVNRGIANKIEQTKSGYDITPREEVEYLLDELSYSPTGRLILGALMDWASKEIGHSEANHHAKAIDGARQ